MRGTVSLYQNNGKLVTTRIYDVPSERKRVVETWRKLYAAGFYNCYIQIAPDTKDTNIGEDGRNKKRYEFFNIV